MGAERHALEARKDEQRELNKGQKSSSQQPASPALEPPLLPQRPAVPSPLSKQPSPKVSTEEATRTVLAVLAAKSGYEPAMIESDMALETELGVDSIKRVEILS